MSSSADIGPLHRLVLTPTGTFDLAEPYSSRPEDIDALFDHLREQGVEHLVLYFHGGKTGEETGMDTARHLLRFLRDEVGVHPYFWIWQSSERDVIRAQLARLGVQPEYVEMLETILGMVRDRLGGGGRGLGDEAFDREPTDAELAALDPVTDADEAELERRLAASGAFQEAVAGIEEAVVAPEEGGRSLDAPAPTADISLLDPALVEEIEAEAGGRSLALPIAQAALALFSRKARNVLRRVVGRYRDGTHHGLRVTVTEELLREFYLGPIGGELWAGMKREIEDAFQDNAGREGADQHAGTAFLERLRDYVTDDANPPLRVSMIGHSAGSIYVCRMLERAAQIAPELRFHQLIFLAPGVNFELFKRAVVDHPERYDGFVMYTMSDELERTDQMLPDIYPYSLLYCVSGVFEGEGERPIVGMERFYTRAHPYDNPDMVAVSDFVLAESPARVAWSHTDPTAPVGLRCEADVHGHFPLAKYPLTRQSMKAVLQGALGEE